MNLAQERKLLKQAFEAFKAGNDEELRNKAKALAYVPEVAAYDLAVKFYSTLNCPGNKFSPREKFYGECVLGQLYFMVQGESIDRDLVAKALGEAQDHFDQAYVISKSLFESETEAVEILKKKYLEAEKMINGVNMFLRV
jgi:hypothetical protein